MTDAHRKTAVRAFALTAAGAAVSSLLISAAGATAQAATAPACKITDFSTALGPVDAGAGQRYSTLDFTTLDGRTCVLHNDLTNFQFLRGDGASLPTTVHVTGSPKESVTLKPGVVGHLDLHWTVIGGKQFVPRSLIFTLPADDGSNAAPWNGSLVGGSGRLDVGHLHR